MGNKASERVMALLSELAMLKELDKKYEASPIESECEAHRQRRRRHEEIAQEIQALAEETKAAH